MESRVDVRFTLHNELFFVSLNDTIADRQPQPCTFRAILGGIEGIEDPIKLGL